MNWWSWQFRSRPIRPLPPRPGPSGKRSAPVSGLIRGCRHSAKGCNEEIPDVAEYQFQSTCPGRRYGLADEVLALDGVLDFVGNEKVKLGLVARLRGGPLHHHPGDCPDMLRERRFRLLQRLGAEFLRDRGFFRKALRRRPARLGRGIAAGELPEERGALRFIRDLARDRAHERGNRGRLLG